MSTNGRLTPTQIEIVCHLCNGLTLVEIAAKMNYSLSGLKGHLTRAKVKVDAKTTTHLASIVIASGVLVWTDDGERVTGTGLPVPGHSA